MRFATNFAWLTLLLFSFSMSAEDLRPDPDRIFVTPLKWERVAGAPRSEKERVAHGTLSILYLEGTYVEVRASFVRVKPKQGLSLNLNEHFIIRLGGWSRTDDDQLIRVESREIALHKVVPAVPCKTAPGERTCTPQPEATHGPLITRTCRLEGASSTHIAAGFICSDRFNMQHLQEQIDLADLPKIIGQILAQQKRAN